jgi:hypothetical protein
MLKKQKCTSYFVTRTPTSRLASGAIKVTEGKATNQDASHDPIHTLKKWGSKPTALKVATPEIMKDMMADKMMLNRIWAYFLGIMMVYVKYLKRYEILVLIYKKMN